MFLFILPEVFIINNINLFHYTQYVTISYSSISLGTYIDNYSAYVQWHIYYIDFESC